MRPRCLFGWHQYDRLIVKVIYGVRVSQDECGCGAYRNFTWKIIEREEDA